MLHRTGIYLSALFLFAAMGAHTPAASGQSQGTQAFRELLERSQKDKKGLTFFIKGQAISGVVIKSIGSEAVEVRNQSFSRIIIRLDSVDALAMN